MLSTRHRVPWPVAFAAAALAATLLAPFGANAAQEKPVVYYENIKGFLAMPGNSVKSPALTDFDASAAGLAYQRTVDFLNRHL